MASVLLGPSLARLYVQRAAVENGGVDDGSGEPQGLWPPCTAGGGIAHSRRSLGGRAGAEHPSAEAAVATRAGFPSPPEPRSTCSTPGACGSRGTGAPPGATDGGLLLHSMLFAQHTADLVNAAAGLRDCATQRDGGGAGAAARGFGRVPCQCRRNGECDHSEEEGEEEEGEEEGGSSGFSIGRTAARGGPPPQGAPSLIGHPWAQHAAPRDAPWGVGGGAAAAQPNGGGVGPYSVAHQRMLHSREVRRSSSDCAARLARVIAMRERGAAAPQAPVRAPPARRFSISRAKSILAECAVGAGDRGGFVACDAGVLAPLLARIRAGGSAPFDAADGSMDSDGSFSYGARRSLSELWPASSRASAAAPAPSDGFSWPLRRPSADGFAPFAAAAAAAASGAPGVQRPVTPPLPGTASSPSSRRSSHEGGDDGSTSDASDASLVPPPLPGGPRCPCPMVPRASVERTARQQHQQQHQQQDELLELVRAEEQEAADAERHQRLIDCLETVAVLAVDATNRGALTDLGALPLLANKLARAAGAAKSGSRVAAAAAAADSAHAGPAARSAAVVAASLRAIVAVARTDAQKSEFWGGPGGGALLSLISRATRGGELEAAAFAAAEALAWAASDGPSSSPTAPAAVAGGGYLASTLYSGSGGSFGSGSVFGSSMYGGGSGDSAPAAPKAPATPRLLEPRVVAAAAGAALHPRSDPAVALLALNLLTLAQQRRHQALRGRRASASGAGGGPGTPPSPTAAAAAVEETPAVAAAWRGVAFAVVPLLVAAARRAVQQQAGRASLDGPPTAPSGPRGRGRPGREDRQAHAVVAAALDLTTHVADDGPQLASALCAAGALPPMLALLLDNGGEDSSAAATHNSWPGAFGGPSGVPFGGSGGAPAAGARVADRVAAALGALTRRGGRAALDALREDAALAALLQALGAGGHAAPVRAAVLSALCLAAGSDAAGTSPRAAAVAALCGRGALRTAQLLAGGGAGGSGEVARRVRELASALAAHPRAGPGRSSGPAAGHVPPGGCLPGAVSALDLKAIRRAL